MRFVRLAFAASLGTLALVSLSGKAALPTEEQAAGLTGDALARATADLKADGWVPVGRLSLTADDGRAVHAFGSPRCNGAVMVTGLPPSGETTSLVARMAGADGLLLFLTGDGLTPEPPEPGAYVLSKLAPVLSRLGVPTAWMGAGAPVAVVMLGACANSALLPWDPAVTVARPAPPPASEPTPAPLDRAPTSGTTLRV